MDTPSVKSIFDTMSYPETLTGISIYEDWLSKHPYEKCIHYTGNSYSDEYDYLRDPLRLNDAKRAATSSPWIDPIGRSTLLLKLSQAVEKQKILFASVESGSTKKPLTRTKERDIPELVEHLGIAAQAVASCPDGWVPHGVVGILTGDRNSPTLAQSLQLGPALAAGNAVVICTSQQNYPSVLLLAETARDVGFPVGILSVACEVPSYIIDCNAFDLVIGSGLHRPKCTSSRLKWRQLARPKAIVTETADLASAAQGIVQLASFNAPMSPSSGACVLVQENIYDAFWAEVQGVFKRLCPLKSAFSDNGDFYYETTSTNHSEVRAKNVKDAETEGAEVIFPELQNSSNAYDVPLLVHRIRSTSPLLENKTTAGSQVIWIQSYRHFKEAVTLANGFPFTNHVSIWGEQASVSLDIAKEIRASNVWINTQNITDAAGDLDTSIFLCKTLPKTSKLAGVPVYESPFDRAQFGKDVRSAVSLARTALKKWTGLGSQHQFRFMFSLASAFRSHEDELKEIVISSCISKDIELFRKIVSRTDISGLKPKSSSTSSATCWSWSLPHGVLGIVLPPWGTFQSLLVSVGTALAAGNAVLAVLHSSVIGDLCKKITAISNIPPGMVSFLVYDEDLDGTVQELLAADLDAAWILTYYSNVSVHRKDLPSETLPISYLDLSDYEWEGNSSHRAVREWLRKQATSAKKVWFECGGSI